MPSDSFPSDAPVLDMAVDISQIKGHKESPNDKIRLRRVDSLDAESNKVSSMAHRKVLTTAVVLQLAYQSFGIVYGDVGISPLYVLSATFPYGIKRTDDLLGAMSLIFYTLTLVPLAKYVFIVLNATDHGEGGTFALCSLICRHAGVGFLHNDQVEDQDLSTFELRGSSAKLNRAIRVRQFLERSKAANNTLLILALLGTSMVIGDGVMTPAISVLSAVSGLYHATPTLGQHVIVIVSVSILVVLFSVQKFGTTKVGFMFAPAVLSWFALIGSIGLYNIIKHDPAIIRALNPAYIYAYFNRNKKRGWVSLGGIVLATTGTEAMFADVGHFSVPSIQIAFGVVVYPCLLLAYFGQAAYLTKFPGDVGEAFYKSIPSALFWPQFAIALAAAIIASQAVISATFTIVKQSVSLGCFPRVTVVHTSSKVEGQVYIPAINWLLMIACICVTVAFQTTDRIANAHGIPVVAVMLVTTSLMTVIMIMIWQLRLIYVLAFALVFGSIDMLYFSSVLYKFTKGGYLPLVFSVVLLFVMYVWFYVTTHRHSYEVENKVSPDALDKLVPKINRVDGVALVYTELVQGVPYIFSHMVQNLPALHSVVVFVSVKFLPVTTVQEDERFLVRRVGQRSYHMYRCVARYGYKDMRETNDVFQRQLLSKLVTFISCEALEGAVNFVAQDSHSMHSAIHDCQDDIDELDSLDKTVGIPAGEVRQDPRLLSWISIRSMSHHSETQSGRFSISSIAPGRLSASSVVPVGEFGLPNQPKRQSSRSSSAANAAQVGRTLSRKPSILVARDPAIQADLKEELRILQAANESGVVYLLGHSSVRASSNSPLLKRFIVNHAYEFFRRNFRSGIDALIIPHDKALSVGMVSYI